MKLENNMNLDSCKNLDKLFEDNAYQIIYNHYWSDYEESGFIYILEKNNKFYEFNYQNSVMSNDNKIYWNPVEVTLNEILAEIINWEKENEFIFFAISKDAWEAVNYNNYSKNFIYSNDELPLEFIYSKFPNKFTLYTNPLLCISNIDGDIDDYLIVSTLPEFLNMHFNDKNHPFKRKNLKSVNNNDIIDSFLVNNKIDYLFEENEFVKFKEIVSSIQEIKELPYRKLLTDNFREVINELHNLKNQKSSFFY